MEFLKKIWMHALKILSLVLFDLWGLILQSAFALCKHEHIILVAMTLNESVCPYVDIIMRDNCSYHYNPVLYNFVILDLIPWYLSHPPILGWLYVFSLFPPRPRPRPPPQKLSPLTSKPFQLNLWYLAQRIYGSGEMYWMTFPWPWPKVTAVASISKKFLVCAIKWEPLIGSLQNVAALLP